MILRFILALALTSQMAMAESLTKNIDKVVAGALGKRIVGTVIIVARDGKVVYRKAHGLMDREHHMAMKEDTIFRFASMTKPLVSVITLKLIEDGILKLNDPVTKWLPDFKPQLADGSIPVITIENLLTHTSGLNYGFFEAANGPYHQLKVSDGMDDVGITLDENIQRLSKAPLLFKPGSAWKYSLSIDVLGLVIEKATKLSLSEALHKFITAPLNMKDTNFFTASADRLSTPYVDGELSPVKMTDFHQNKFGESAVDFTPARALNKNAFPSGGAGAVGTADDYLKFLEVLRTGGAPLLTSKTNQLIFKNKIGELKTQAGPGWSWSLIASVMTDPKAAKSSLNEGTIQWGGAYGHTWWVDSKAKLTVIILTNTAFEGMSGKFPDEIKAAIY